MEGVHGSGGIDEVGAWVGVLEFWFFGLGLGSLIGGVRVPWTAYCARQREKEVGELGFFWRGGRMDGLVL